MGEYEQLDYTAGVVVLLVLPILFCLFVWDIFYGLFKKVMQ
jgi:hypothetical protein